MTEREQDFSWIEEIQAISFDFGDTLFEYSGNSEEFKLKEREFLLRLFQKYDIPIKLSPDEFIRRFRKIYWARIEDNFAHLRDDPDLVPRFTEFFEYHGIEKIDIRIVNEMAAAYGNFRFSPSTLIPYPETREILEFLKKRNLRTIVISNIPSRGAPNSPDFIRAILEAYNLNKYFSELIYSGDIGVLKPHPKIFHFAEKCLNIPPSRILHIGDNWEADIGGAKNRGWHTYWISHGKQTPEDSRLADEIGKNSGEFLEWIRAILA